MIEKVPFDQRGNLLEYVAGRGTAWCAGPDGSVGWHPIVWMDNEPVKMTLTLNSMERGRSAARFIWKSEDGRKYPMFMTDMLALIKEHVIDHGKVEAEWIVKKRGQNYGVAVYK